MQRIAVLALCGVFLGPTASAQSCAALSAIVSGFTGGATGFGMTRYIGPATNWVAAGLYGAGMAAGALGTNELIQRSCDRIRAIMEATAEISCFAGEYLCESVEDVARSLVRDFEICTECTVDEVMTSFPMEDFARLQHLTRMQLLRNGPYRGLRTIERNDILGRQSADRLISSYYSGIQASYSLQSIWRQKAIRLN